MFNIVVIGSVNSTAETINALTAHGLKPKGILGYKTSDVRHVSGWADLEMIAFDNKVPFRPFENINLEEHLKWVEELNPDIIFAVGFSQLLKKEWLELPKLGCIGFHPTKLPSGRGRAPIAWLILEEDEGASTFFLMGEGADNGPIFVQKSFTVEKNDDASNIQEKILSTLREALNEWLPKLKKGDWNPVPQDENKATWYGKRTPEDGLIDWSYSANSIDRLIKASTKPYPGAYTFIKHEKVIIWDSYIENNLKIKGVVGRVLLKDVENGVLVQCGEGLLWLKSVSKKIGDFNIGQKLGFEPQNEIDIIWKEIKKLKNE